MGSTLLLRYPAIIDVEGLLIDFDHAIDLSDSFVLSQAFEKDVSF